MIVLSAGMPKSGSAWFFNMLNDMLVRAGHDDVRNIRERFHLESVLQHYNCNVDELSPEKLSRILIPHDSGHTFVIKTHSGPTPMAQALIEKGTIKPVYIFRDPRDVALSAMDHGKQLRRAGQNHVFTRCDTLENSVQYVKEWLQIWEQWTRIPQVSCVRYEDLSADPQAVLEQAADFLNLNVTTEAIRRIINSYDKSGITEESAEFLHFNNGTAQRFKSVMSSDEQHYCTQQFGHYLHKMNCSI